MKPARKSPHTRKPRRELLADALPQFEQFIESRESYIKALEVAIEALRTENQRYNKNSHEIRSSIDELVAMQRLSNSIGAAAQPEQIVTTLIDLTMQVIPVLDSNIFLFQEGRNTLLPLSSRGTEALNTFASAQVEAGIADWVIAEKKTVIIPDIDSLGAKGNSRNFVIVPLILRNLPIGIFVIHTEKPQTDFSNQDIQLLSVLATQAASGVENWRTYDELMKANEQLKASQAQMIQAAKLAAIGELAASVVHEIKNPLQIMMMHLEMVERGRPLSNWTELLGQQVNRLSEITKRLMNFARNVTDDVLMESVHLNKAIEDVVAIIQHDFKSSNITIELDLAPDLPTIAGNANYLQQVFLNLAINARDAMAKGGIFTVRSSVKGASIHIEVRDTGCGIAREHLENIFIPFFTTKELGKGTGLGLSVCSKIVERHGGKISVASEVGKGTTFTVTLPLRRAQ